MAQIASSMINPYENVMVRYGEIFQFAACWSLPEGMRTLIGSYSYLRCASQELLMYAINIGNTQHTVGNETQSNWCRWVANHLQFPGCMPKYGVIQCCTTQYFGESSQWMNHSLFGLICGIFQHVFWFSNMTHMVLVFEGITLTLAWLLANDELYSYTYLYVYIYINILYTQLYIYISLFDR